MMFLSLAQWSGLLHGQMNEQVHVRGYQRKCLLIEFEAMAEGKYAD